MVFTNATFHSTMKTIEDREAEEQNFLLTFTSRWWNYFAQTKVLVSKAKDEVKFKIEAIKREKWPQAIESKKIEEVKHWEQKEIQKDEMQFLNETEKMVLSALDKCKFEIALNLLEMALDKNEEKNMLITIIEMECLG
jgi:hypothetical protein